MVLCLGVGVAGSGLASTRPIPYTCYSTASAGVWESVKATVLFASRWYHELETAAGVYRPTPTPGNCYAFTQPYTDYRSDYVWMAQAYKDSHDHGGYMAAEVHSHPTGWSPAGFSDEDLDEVPYYLPLAVLIEDGGRCVRFYDLLGSFWGQGYSSPLLNQGQCR
jgi:hypothetical protein